MENATTDPQQDPTGQDVEEGGLMVTVTDAFGTTGGSGETPSDETGNG